MNKDSISIHEQETITIFIKRIGEFSILNMSFPVEHHLRQAYRLCYHAILTINYGAEIHFVDDEGVVRESLWGVFSDNGFNKAIGSDPQKELYSLSNSMQEFINKASLHPITKQSLQLSCNEVLLAYLNMRVQL